MENEKGDNQKGPKNIAPPANAPPPVAKSSGEQEKNKKEGKTDSQSITNESCDGLSKCKDDGDMVACISIIGIILLPAFFGYFIKILSTNGLFVYIF